MNITTGNKSFFIVWFENNKMPKNQKPLSQAHAIIIAAGITALIGGIFALLAATKPTEMIINATMTAEYKSIHIMDLQKESGSQWVGKDQIVVMADDEGVAVLEFGDNFYHIPPHQCGWSTEVRCEESYRWKYRSYGTSNIITGEGAVYEHYASTPEIGGNQLVDLGTVSEIDIVSIHIRWSQAGEDDSWIYFTDLGVGIVDKIMFDTLDLSKIFLK